MRLVGFILGFAFATLVFSSSTWATTFWHEVGRTIAAGTYASEDFLYASPPNLAACAPGTLTQKAKARALAGMNRIRALHGLAPVRYSYRYDQSVQEAALIQATNDYVGHHLPSSARCYTPAGAEASESSNLSRSGWRGRGRDQDPVEEMIGWTHDAQSTSPVAEAGHRRWLLNPFVTYLSYGQVYGHTVQKVFDFDHEPATAPLITVDYVAFPYETYPALFMEDDPPWSFSVVENKTDRWKNKHSYFQLATVTVTRLSDGTRLRVSDVYTDTKGRGVPNFLSWQVAGWEYDTPYQVTIRNVAMQTRKLRSYSYQVVLDRAGKRPAIVRKARTQTQEISEPPRVERKIKRSQQRVVTREAREREARAAARAAKRLEEYRD